MSNSPDSANKEIGKQLLECSILIVSILLKQYKTKLINITDFKNHTVNKISYIVNNLDSIKDVSERRKVENLLNECQEINKIL